MFNNKNEKKGYVSFDFSSSYYTYFATMLRTGRVFDGYFSRERVILHEEGNGLETHKETEGGREAVVGGGGTHGMTPTSF